MSEIGYSGTKAASVVGISYRQLDYWARTDLVRPSLVDAAGSGSRRAYSYRDLLELRLIKSLLDAGIKLESVRAAFEYLRGQVTDDIASAHLVISGGNVLLCDGDELIDVVRKGAVRRAKLYYLRGRTGKSARIAERQTVRPAKGAVVPETGSADKAGEEA